MAKQNKTLSRDIRVLNLSIATLNRSLGGELPIYLPPEMRKSDGTIKYLTYDTAEEILRENKKIFQLLGYDRDLLVGQTQQGIKANIVDMLIESGLVAEDQREKLLKQKQGDLYKIYSQLRHRFGHKVFLYQYVPQDKYTFEELFTPDIDDVRFVDELLAGLK